MRKNIYIKSITRQPLRSLLLFVLIALAAFVLVLRVTEFMVMHRHIHSIGENYRSIGFLQVEDELADISSAADIIATSPHLGLEDRRRVLEAVMHNIYNPVITYIRPGIVAEDTFRYLAVYFYGNVLDIDRTREAYGIISMQVQVYEVLAGLPEHIPPDAILQLYYIIDYSDDISFISEFELFGTYLFKGHSTVPSLTMLVPLHGAIWRPTPLNIQPLPEPKQMAYEIARINHETRAITIQTTTDMAIMRDMQGRRPALTLREGRIIDYNDYINANPVAVITWQFARIRGLNVGDTLTLAVHENQFIHSSTFSILYKQMAHL